MKQKNILRYQKSVLKAVAGKINNFYLAGGTALSLFYFQHRLSIDLDFFTSDFKQDEVKGIMEDLRKKLKVKVELIGRSVKEETAKIMVYNICFRDRGVLKIDFVEDVNELIKKTNVVSGINILSLEDIYIRKIYALSGSRAETDKVGRLKLTGGRFDAKDFYDIYCLSSIFMPLSKFVEKYCSVTSTEGLIRWFHAFDRMNMMDGISELITDKKIDYKMIERHFKKELDKIAEQVIGDI